jgi:hypothetical protein
MGRGVVFGGFHPAFHCLFDVWRRILELRLVSGPFFPAKGILASKEYRQSSLDE